MRLQDLVEQIGELPSAERLSAMSDTELEAYLVNVLDAENLLRSLEPTSADQFEQQWRYVDPEIDLTDITALTRGDGIIKALEILIRPQVVADGELGGRAHREDIRARLLPHSSLVAEILGIESPLRFLPTTFPPIEVHEGPVLRNQN